MAGLPPATESGIPMSYTPPANESPYYESLFLMADSTKAGVIGGREAVEFLSKSKLPVDLLKNIWNIADQNPKTNTLDKSKFFVAVRLIQLFQNGQKAQGPNLAAANESVVMRPPYFEGVTGVSVQPYPPPGSAPAAPPTPTNSNSMTNNMSMSMRNMGPPPTPSNYNNNQSILATQDPYTMQPVEQGRYENLFPQYQQPDGFVYGKEAVELFSKSGLTKEVLRDIWNMVDNPVDNRLSKLEFAIAMHLIVCISKKNLPMPPMLPMSLKYLKDQEASANTASSVPPPGPAGMNMNTTMNSPNVMNPPEQQQQQPQTRANIPSVPSSPNPSTNNPPPILPSFSADSGTQQPMMSMSYPTTLNTNYNLPSPHRPVASRSIPSSPAISSQSAPKSIPEPMPPPSIPRQSFTTTPVPTMTTTSSNNPSPHNNNNDELEKMRSLLQKLQAENISLKAQLGQYTQEENSVREQISFTLSEISTLSQELNTLRASVVNSKANLIEATSELKGCIEKRNTLQELVHETKALNESINLSIQEVKATIEEAKLQNASNEANPNNALPQRTASTENFNPSSDKNLEADLFSYDDGSVYTSTLSQSETAMSYYTNTQSQAPSTRNKDATGYYPYPTPTNQNHHPPIPEDEMMGGSAPITGTTTASFGNFSNYPPTPSFDRNPSIDTTTSNSVYKGGNSNLGDGLEKLNGDVSKAEKNALEADDHFRALSLQLEDMNAEAEHAERIVAELEQSKPKKKGLFKNSKSKDFKKDVELAYQEAYEKRRAVNNVQQEVAAAQRQSIQLRRQADTIRQKYEIELSQQYQQQQMMNARSDFNTDNMSYPPPPPPPSENMMGVGGNPATPFIPSKGRDIVADQNQFGQQDVEVHLESTTGDMNGEANFLQPSKSVESTDIFNVDPPGANFNYNNMMGYPPNPPNNNQTFQNEPMGFFSSDQNSISSAPIMGGTNTSNNKGYLSNDFDNYSYSSKTHYTAPHSFETHANYNTDFSASNFKSSLDTPGIEQTKSDATSVHRNAGSMENDTDGDQGYSQYDSNITVENPANVSVPQLESSDNFNNLQVNSLPEKSSLVDGIPSPSTEGHYSIPTPMHGSYANEANITVEIPPNVSVSQLESSDNFSNLQVNSLPEKSSLLDGIPSPSTEGHYSIPTPMHGSSTNESFGWGDVSTNVIPDTPNPNFNNSGQNNVDFGGIPSPSINDIKSIPSDVDEGVELYVGNGNSTDTSNKILPSQHNQATDGGNQHSSFLNGLAAASHETDSTYRTSLNVMNTGSSMEQARNGNGMTMGSMSMSMTMTNSTFDGIPTPTASKDDTDNPFFQ